MAAIWEFIQRLNWAQYWYAYIGLIFLAIILLILLVKLIKNKIKQLFITTFIVVIIILILYVLHIANVIQFDVLRIIGLGGISDHIKNFIRVVSEWWSNLFPSHTVAHILT